MDGLLSTGPTPYNVLLKTQLYEGMILSPVNFTLRSLTAFCKYASIGHPLSYECVLLPCGRLDLEGDKEALWEYFCSPLSRTCGVGYRGSCDMMLE